MPLGHLLYKKLSKKLITFSFYIKSFYKYFLNQCPHPLTFASYIKYNSKKKKFFYKTYYQSTIYIYIYIYNFKIKLEKRKKIVAENESEKSESEYI